MTLVYKSDEQQTEATRQFFQHDKFYELQLVPYRDKQGNLQTIYGTGRDITEAVNAYKQIQRNSALLQQANDEVSQYIRNTNFVLQNGGVRLANYSPDTHTLVIYSEIDHAQNTLTQTRVMALTDDKSRKVVRRLITNMDNRTRSTQSATVKTALRIKGRQLCIYLSFIPTLDDQGQVTGYFGMCRDISEIIATEELLAQETEKAQEVEAVKDAFLRNMCYEIRTPLNCVVGFAELIENDPNAEEEKIFIEEIKKNSRNLLNLVNNILFLSRLDAGMIEFKTVTVDFATFFE
jgi:PAS domain S-box-containing protein